MKALKNFFSNFKLLFKPFKPYTGSSEAFAYLYQYALDELECECCDTGRVLDTIDSLSSMMQTSGDGRLIIILQGRLRMRMHEVLPCGE